MSLSHEAAFVRHLVEALDVAALLSKAQLARSQQSQSAVFGDQIPPKVAAARL